MRKSSGVITKTMKGKERQGQIVRELGVIWVKNCEVSRRGIEYNEEKSVEGSSEETRKMSFLC
jgi:hypothetical protein